jgi:hypothetical protein|tara:strand:- start:807 stop:977 length:171 start_codon:yes stop_codon:yes gene_type:complete
MVEKKKVNLIVSIAFIFILLFSFVLMVFQILNYIIFWVIAIFAAIYAFKILPKVKK